MIVPEPARLHITGVSKSFGATQALKPFDLEVVAGEVHALVGENGSGKSTLIKILAGVHIPDEGTIDVAGVRLRPGSPESSYAAGCRFVHQDLGLIDDLTVADNLFIGSRFPSRFGTVLGRVQRAEAVRMLQAVGVDIDPSTRVGDLSPAVRTGVALARALRSGDGEPTQVLVLDEPTATMPDDEVVRLLTMVRHVAASGAAVLYVSHRLDEIFQLCSRVTVLRDGQRVAVEPVASLDRHRLIQLLVGSHTDGSGPYNEEHVATAPVTTAGRIRALTVTELRAPGIHGFSLEAKAGTITGIAGITGSGRESILATVFGAAARTAGLVTVGDEEIRGEGIPGAIRAGISYLPADRKSLGGLMDLTARENLTVLGPDGLWQPFWIAPQRERGFAQEWFDRLSVRPRRGQELPLAAFSGGNQQKILLGKWLSVEPTVLLLDEPTQGVDIGAKAVLHEQIVHRARQGTAVVISSTDVEELVGLCDRVLVLSNGEQIAELTGAAITADTITRASLGQRQENSR